MFKRLIDIIFSLIALIISAPLVILIAVLIRLDSAGPIFFKQNRVGRNEKMFQIYKFRTMVEDAQLIGPVITAQNDPRITQVGSLLRWLKLDEIPQFFNVLKGDMSLVGPRPEVPEIVEKYTAEQLEVLKTKPGIFGPNQIVHRDESAQLPEQGDVEHFYHEKILPEKIERDLKYVRNNTRFKDLRLLLMGAYAVIFRSVKLRYIFESRRRISFLIVDLLILTLCFWISFLLRFEGKVPDLEMHHFFKMLPYVIVLSIPCFVYFGLYQTLWQYLGIQELFAILKAVTVICVVTPAIPFILQFDFLPRAVLIIFWFSLVVFLGASRVIFKITAERLRKPLIGTNRKNALIVGAEDAGELLVREFIKNKNLAYKPVGFLDDDPLKVGVRIHGIKVMGKLSQIAQVVRVKKVDEVIIASSEISGEKIKAIIHTCRNLKLICRIVPEASSLLNPSVLPLRLRPVDVSDLLGRKLVEADVKSIQTAFTDKRVLITGAGGSIGSELARILYQNHPAELILVDISENNLYDIEMDLRHKALATKLSFYLRDVTQKEKMEEIFKKHKPHVIYHAAANKHVPIVEMNYQEGIKNNVLGTKQMADLALAHHAECFVLISTDKAINPTSIMGCTKRISELYLQNLKNPKTRFHAVRFGNVFNSKGSVVPLFRKQIEEGGPVTVTHPEMTRYFMDVSEAVFLILQATILGNDSEIFVLDMGKPVKIDDLARNLIQLMGLTEQQISIRYLGLRPGEKIFEELELDSEHGIPTAHKKIKIWKSKFAPNKDVHSQIEDLLEMIKKEAKREEILKQLEKMVPEYTAWRENP